jgi:hypothetical protein
VSGHGNDRNSAARGECFPLPNRRDGLEAVHLRHLHIHQDQVKLPVFERFQRTAAVVCHHNGVSLFFQSASCHSLVDGIVLRDEDSQSAPQPPKTRAFRREAPGLATALGFAGPLQAAAEQRLNGFEEIGGLDRLRQVRADVEGSAAVRVTSLTDGTKHDNLRP